MTRQLISIILGLCFYSCANKNADNTPVQEIDTLHSANDKDTIVRHFNIDPYKIFAEYAKGYKPVGANANPNIAQLSSSPTFPISGKDDHIRIKYPFQIHLAQSRVNTVFQVKPSA